MTFRKAPAAIWRPVRARKLPGSTRLRSRPASVARRARATAGVKPRLSWPPNSVLRSLTPRSAAALISRVFWFKAIRSDVAAALLSGQTPKADTTLFDTPTKLFVPVVVTAQNLKAEIIDKQVNGKPIETADVLCTGAYADGCKKLGITP